MNNTKTNIFNLGKGLSQWVVLFCITILNQVALAVNWETVLNCNNNAAIVQINPNDRRNYQMVIKDPNIIVYFNGTGSFKNAGNNFGNGREFIVSGYLQNGVFNGSDFKGGNGNYNYGDSFKLERYSSGLKITLLNINAWSTCDGDVSPSTGMCNGTVRSGVNVHEYGNWYFDHCQ